MEQGNKKDWNKVDKIIEKSEAGSKKSEIEGGSDINRKFEELNREIDRVRDEALRKFQAARENIKTVEELNKVWQEINKETARLLEEARRRIIGR